MVHLSDNFACFNEIPKKAAMKFIVMTTFHWLPCRLDANYFFLQFSFHLWSLWKLTENHVDLSKHWASDEMYYLWLIL